MERSSSYLPTWIVHVCLGLGAVGSLFTGSEVASWYLMPLTVVYLLVAPGIVLLELVGFELKLGYKWLIYSVALSILFLYLAGLVINYGVPEISQTLAPLSDQSLRVGIFSIFMPLLVIATIRNWRKGWSYEVVEISYRHMAGVLLLGLPLLAVAGAFMVNRDGNNIVTLIYLVIVGGVFAYMGVHERFKKWYPLVVLSTGLSLLWMLSFRSAFPVGWDIAEEMAVFSRTAEFGRWIPAVFNPAYNACLSITILPTILVAFLPLSNAAIFKIIYPAVFSLVSLSGYLLGKRVLGHTVAYVGIFYMMAQPLFIQPMIGLSRQMIAMVFFGALIMNLFSKEYDRYSSKLLSYLLVTGMVLSHYSTSYIAIFLLMVTYAVMLVYKNSYVDHLILRRVYGWLRLRSEGPIKSQISFMLILYTVVITVLWYSQVNKSATGVLGIATQTLESLSDIFIKEVESEEALKAVSVFSESQTEEKLGAVNGFVESTSEFFTNTDVKESLASFYRVTYLPERFVAGNFNSTWSFYVIRGFELLKTFMKFMVPVGSVLLVWTMFRRTKQFKEFIILSVVANLLISIILFHPTLGRYYNVTRLSMQSLTFLALIAVYGVFALSNWMGARLQRYMAVGIVVAVFLLNYGLVYVVTGGYPFLHLYNYGDDFNKFYYSKGEIDAAQWLANNKGYSTPIFTDSIGNLRLMMGARIRGLPSVMPSVVYDKSYVYLRRLNLEENRYSSSFSGQSFSYTFSPVFFDESKNLVYSNPHAKIYR